MIEEKKKVLFIEDDPVDRMAFDRIIRSKILKYDFKVVTSVAEAIHALTTEQFDLIVTDFHLGDGDAIEVVRAAPNIASIITTGTGDQITAVKAIKEGVYEYLVKDPARHYLEILPHTMDSVLAQHAARMEVKRLEGWYRALSDASPLGIYGTDLEGNCNYTNSRYQEISGLSHEQCLGYGWMAAIHPDDRERVQKEWYEAAVANKQYDSTHRFLKSDGRISWCRVKAASIRDGETILGYVGTLEDVTARKQAEDRLRLATSVAKIGIWQWEVQQNLLHWDDSMLEIYGVKKDDFLGAYETWQEALLPEDREKAEGNLQAALKDGKKYDVVFRIRRSDGVIRYIQANGTVERDENQKPICMVGTNLDITEQRDREEELARLHGTAQAATYAKSQFLANMSHEIRTPLTSIIGFAEAAKEQGVCEDDRVRAFETIFSNGKHLLGVINDILDYSKIDAGALKIEALPFSPVALVENVRTLMLPRVAEKGLDLAINYKWELPRTITSDSMRLMQVLVNLMSNAIKFTEYGKVEIIIACDREKEQLHFSIKDTGIGLTEEQIPRLFQTFSQANLSTTRIYGGTGLGLSISKKLVERLGGDIVVESVPTKGSTFSFFINTGVLAETDWISSVPETSVESDSSATVLRELSGKILIADDAEDNRNLMKFTLRKTGLDITLVDNGGIALSKALSEHFDLILLDMQMPIMDGYTAAREMRKKGITVPIVAFTANAMKQDIINCIEAGCTTHLPKPFKKEVLFECLYQQLRKKQAPMTSDNPVISEKFVEDPEFLDIVLDFVEGLEKRMRDLSNALDEENFANLEDTAHRLSGSAGLFGYHAMSELASLLESKAKESQLADAKGLFEQLKPACMAIQSGVATMKGSKETLAKS